MEERNWVEGKDGLASKLTD